MYNSIKYLVMDVDGTLTDGKIYTGFNGEVFKVFDVKDGYAIHEMLPSKGISPVVITGRQSTIVKERCRELGIQHVFQGVVDKLTALKCFLRECNCDLNCVAYMGDDLNDLRCMMAVKAAGGLIASPADAVEAVRDISDYIAPRNGGSGAVRAFVDWLLLQQETSLLQNR